MTKYDLQIGQEIQWAQSEADVSALYARRIISRDTPCRISGTEQWMDVNEFFPTLKYGCPTPVPELPAASVDLDRDERHKPALTSSLKAGWICFGLALAVAWIFPPAFFFYSVALVLAVVALCTHQVNKGLALLLATFVGMGTSAMLSFFLAVGLFTITAGSAIAKANKQMEATRQQQAQMLAAQQRMIASIPRFTTPPPKPLPTAMPIQGMSKRQLFDEIARIEKQHRDLRKAGRDVPLGNEDYLDRLKIALDAGR